jgi:2-dehydro-3-deoxy-D-arabinonate dehydratase
MKLYRTTEGVFVEKQGGFYSLDGIGWDELIGSEDLLERLRQATSKQQAASFDAATILPPIVSQEVWAAGVTYYRSRSARIEESKDAGGGDFYDRVYSAERPELFFKAAGGRVKGPGQPVRIRSDAKWSVPEPELTLLINPRGTIVGYTVGNDMSSRDIEGETPSTCPRRRCMTEAAPSAPAFLSPRNPRQRRPPLS